MKRYKLTISNPFWNLCTKVLSRVLPVSIATNCGITITVCAFYSNEDYLSKPIVFAGTTLGVHLLIRRVHGLFYRHNEYSAVIDELLVAGIRPGQMGQAFGWSMGFALLLHACVSAMLLILAMLVTRHSPHFSIEFLISLLFCLINMFLLLLGLFIVYWNSFLNPLWLIAAPFVATVFLAGSGSQIGTSLSAVYMVGVIVAGCILFKSLPIDYNTILKMREG